MIGSRWSYMPCHARWAAVVLIAQFLTADIRADELPVANSKQLSHTSLLVVVGATGDESYDKVFRDELALWRRVAQASDVELTVIGEAGEGHSTDKETLQATIERESTSTPERPWWIVFIGHGTFDGRLAAMNLRGPDVSHLELAEWLKPCRRPLAVINTTAASSPFLTSLSGARRVIISATKSGQERNYARFGRYFAQRVIDVRADLDKDDQTSLLEAFLSAARDTSEFYKQEGRIATEHPLLDDNGDARGIRPEFFTRDRLTQSPVGQMPDGELARRWCLKPSLAERQLTAVQLVERDRLEAELAALRRRKQELTEEAYLAELERILLALAQLYQP